MREPDVFVLADQTLNAVVQQIPDHHWDKPMPDWFQLGGGQIPAKTTLRTVINYHAYDDAWVPDVLAGKTMAEVGETKWKDEDLLGNNPKSNFAAIVDKAISAAKALDDPSRTAHLSFGDYTVQEFLWQANSFRGFRANQLARVLAIDDTIPPELVQALWDELTPHAEEWRAIGIFKTEIPVPDDAPLQQRLLGKFGYEPTHQAR